jgi:uncharacterized membrane-anchored protein
MKERRKMNVSAIILFVAVFAAISWLKTRFPWLANLPGDIKIPVGGAQIVLPLATCIITGVIVTVIMLVSGKRQ